MAEDKAETGRILAILGLVFSVVGVVVSALVRSPIWIFMPLWTAVSPLILCTVGIVFAVAGYSQNKAMDTIATIAVAVSIIAIIIGGIDTEYITSPIVLSN